MAFRLGVRTKPLNKSGQNLKPTGASADIGAVKNEPQTMRRKPGSKSKLPPRKVPQGPATPQESAVLDSLMKM